MITLKKDGSTKLVDEGSVLIPILKGDGWLIDGEAVTDDLETLRAKADVMGIKYHHKAKAETIAKMIEEAECLQHLA